MPTFNLVVFLVRQVKDQQVTQTHTPTENNTPDTQTHTTRTTPQTPKRTPPTNT